MKDPYKVLGVSPDATEAEITKAYRKLVKKYHPDLNHNDPAAAEKMSEVNAAYEAIKNGTAASYGSDSSSSGGYGGYGGYGGQGSYSQYDFPFGGFPFSGYSQQSSSQREYSEYDSVRAYLNAGHYTEALHVLSEITDRTAQWYYYSAVANYYNGSTITARSHANTAVQMDPNNQEYRRLLAAIERGGQVYRQHSQSFGIPNLYCNNLCTALCLAQFFCFFCGRTPIFCC